MNKPIHFQDHSLRLDEGTVFAREWRPANATGSAIVLLHDSLGCVEMWREFPELLAQATGRRVIAYDRLGFGRSSERRDVLALSFVGDESTILARILSAFEVESFVLFGHSVGGGMALVASERIAGCEAVISESAQAFVEQRTVDGIRLAEKDFENPNQLRRLEKYHGARTKWVLESWTKTWLATQFANWSLRAELQGVKAPALVIHGDRDEYGSTLHPERIVSACEGRVEKLIFKNCGHFPHREMPSEVLREVSAFLA